MFTTNTEINGLSSQNQDTTITTKDTRIILKKYEFKKGTRD